MLMVNEHKDHLLEEELQVNWITPQLPISEEKLKMFRDKTAQDSSGAKTKQNKETGLLCQTAYNPLDIQGRDQFWLRTAVEDGETQRTTAGKTTDVG